MEEASKEVVKGAKEVAVEVYKDAAQPIVKPIGEILGFLPRTIKLALSGWERWLINGEESLRLTAEAIKEKAKTIPEDKLVEPEPYVAIPAIQQITYCQNSEVLRDLYASLITASMNVDTKWKVHPSYVDIIKQLNPDEARYIKELGYDINQIHPLIDVHYYPNNSNSYIPLMTNFTITKINILEYPQSICSYIDNLERLKIIEIPPTVHIADENKYKGTENHPIVTQFQNNIKTKEGASFKYGHKCFRLTSFGKNLIEIIQK